MDQAPAQHIKSTLSLVIPVFNEEDVLAACLDAIARQTVLPDEVIIVDNDSTDSSVSIASRYPFVTLLHEEERGIIPARNRGFNHARGDLIGRIDADSIVAPDWVETIKNYYANEGLDRAADAVTGSTATNLPKAQWIGWIAGRVFLDLGYFPISRLMVGGAVLLGCNMAITRNAWERIRDDTSRDSHALHEDVDLSVLIHRAGGTIRHLHTLRVRTSPRSFRESPSKIWWRLRVWPVAVVRHWPVERPRIHLSPQARRLHSGRAGLRPVMSRETSRESRAPHEQ